MVHRFVSDCDSLSGDISSARRFPTRWPARAAFALLLALLALVGLRPGPVAAAYVAPTGPTEILSAGGLHTCALTPDGAVECWGFNAYGQADNHAGPYSQVSAGSYHTCALTPDDEVECWGDNYYNQAGTHAGPYTQVSAGLVHTCALTPDGAVECWGSNSFGQSTTHTGPYSQVSAGIDYTCALTTLGAVECWGLNNNGQANNHAGSYRQVSAGGNHTCAVTTLGVVECWGWNGNGQVGGVNGVHAGPYSQVSAGGNHTCAVTPGGAVECWGWNVYGQVGGVHTGPYSQVSAGGNHTCALTPGGAVECWGNNDSGQVGGANGYHVGPYGPYRPPMLPEIVSAGGRHSCALTPAGAVECWGDNFYGQAGNHAGPYSQVSAGGVHSCALMPAGAVECWGYNFYGQVGGVNGVHAGPYRQVSAGDYHTCALTPAGAVECWGRNNEGQVGGANGYHAGPYRQVSAGFYHTCALTPAGAVECWGDNGYGQAGGANGYHAGPYRQVSAGDYHTCALTPAGAVECWGDNGDGQVGGVHAGPYRQVSAGFYHTCALTPGAVECWGRNIEGQAGNHAGPYSQVSARGNHTCALTTGGAVECWGANNFGQAGNHDGPYGPYVPETSITAAPDDPTNNNDPSFEFTSPDPDAAFECRLDGGAWAACASPQSYTDLADDEHSFEVRAVSPPGNPDDTPATHTWTIDTAAPSVTITAAPPALTNNNDPSFSFSGESGATFECQLDASPFEPCASPISFTDVADGSHTFTVQATDAAGNIGSDSHTWTIDATGPMTTITAAPPDPSDSPDATFAFSGNDGGGSGVASYECRLDGGPWAACASPKSYTGLADGSHTFEVRATDNAGNPGPADSHTWTIDTTTPIYVSTTTTGSIGPLSFGPHDILLWDGHGWSKWFDGAAAQLKPNGNAMHNINALWIPDTAGDDVVLAFAQDARFVPGVSGKVDGTDLVWWNGSSFSLWFDGQDVGLSVLAKEKIDALHVLPGNLSPIGGSCQYYLLISTAGDGKVPNYSGGEIKFDGTDVLGFCMTNSGANTAGFWHRLLNGKAEGMPGQALVNLSASDDGQVLYLTTKGAFNADSAHGSHSVIYRYDLGSGQFSGPFWSARDNGLNRLLDGLQVDGELP